MITQSLIHIAILAYFLVPSATVGKIGLLAGKKSAEKVALIDQTFGQKCVVHSDVPSPLPKESIWSGWNLEQLVPDLDAAREAAMKYRRGYFTPYHDTMPKRFDALLSQASPNAVTEMNGVGEVIAMKLNLYSKPVPHQAELKETNELRSSIRQIGSERSLHTRIGKLSHGWQGTFQLPFAWDNGDSQITHRNESSPPIEETIGYPDIPLWLNPADKEAPEQIFSFFIAFLH